jgi:hypothetical protein
MPKMKKLPIPDIGVDKKPNESFVGTNDEIMIDCLRRARKIYEAAFPMSAIEEKPNDSLNTIAIAAALFREEATDVIQEKALKLIPELLKIIPHNPRINFDGIEAILSPAKNKIKK